MPAKVCPRCGAQYPNLKSTTCPECFAVLVTVDDATAEALTAARAEVEQTPEFQEVKAADDERFKEQSFGACLAVVGMTVLTLILGVVLVVSAAHRPARPAPTTVDGGGARGERFPNSAPPPLGAGGTSLAMLPVAAATLDEVLPPDVGPYRRLSRDQKTVLPGTLTALFHAAYALPGGRPLDVYVLPAGHPTDEQNEFRLGLALSAQTGGDRPLLFFATEYWHFAVLAAPGDPTAPAEFRGALAGRFR